MMVRQLMAVVLDTVREARSRSVFLGMGLAATLSAGLLAWYIQTVTRRGPHDTLTALAQSNPQFLDDAFVAREALATVSSMALWMQTAFAVALLAGLIGPLLSSERNALIAATPIPRAILLLGRYLGVMAVGAFGAIVTYGGLLLFAYWKFGVWHMPVLAGAATALVAVAGTVALLTLFQSCADAPAVSIVAAATMSILAVGGQSPDRVRDMTGSPLAADLAVHLGAIMPRSVEIGQWTAIYVKSGAIADPAPLFYTGLGALGFLAIAGTLFTRKEF